MYLYGLKTGDLAYVKSARYLFPYEKDIAVNEALLLIRNNIVDKKTYLVIKEALKYDPYSAELLSIYTQYAAIYGNRNEAVMAFNTMKKIVPNSNSFKMLQQIRDNSKGF